MAASCALCGGAAQLPHMNCANLDCNRLFLACSACKARPWLALTVPMWARMALNRNVLGSSINLPALSLQQKKACACSSRGLFGVSVLEPRRSMLRS